MTEKPQINAWYRSTIDPQVQGKVIEIDGLWIIVQIRDDGKVTDWCTLAEFVDSWERA